MTTADSNDPTGLSYRVITFYSYKGGVGRSMALANVAALLALKGRRVLAVDFDLEAPGLIRYFDQATTRIVGDAQTGLVDMFVNFRDGMRLNWRKCIVEIKMPAGRGLHLLSAGGGHSDYARLVQSLNWDQLFQEHNFGQYLCELREEWRSEYDVVLIDSRTGMSDIGGICTIILPDALVMLFTANAQSIEGTAEVVRRARAAQETLPVERGRLLAIPMLSRDDRRTEYEQSERWRKRIAGVMAEFFADWVLKDVSPTIVLQKLYLPQIAYWSFGERLPVLERPQELTDPSSIGAAYDRLASLIDSDLNWQASEARDGSLASTRPLPLPEPSWVYSRKWRYRLLYAFALAGLLTSLFSIVLNLWPGGTSTDPADLQAIVASPDASAEDKIEALRLMADRGIIPQGAQLSGIQLDGVRLLGCRGCDLSNSDLSGMNFSSAQFSETDFGNSTLARVAFVGAALSNVDFSGADLRQADFSAATFENVTMRGAVVDFSLQPRQLDGVSGRPIEIESALVDEGLLSPPPTVLTDFHMLTQGQESGWDVDLFWCQGSQETANRAVARSAAIVLAMAAARGEGLAPGVRLGRVRLFARARNDAGNLASGDFIGFEAQREELIPARAIAARLSRDVGVRFEPSPSPGPPTRFYLSVFACRSDRSIAPAPGADSPASTETPETPSEPGNATR